MKSEVKIRTMSESLSPAPGRVSLDVADRVSANSHGNFSFEEANRTLSFEERRVSAISENQNMDSVDMIVVEETTFVN